MGKDSEKLNLIYQALKGKDCVTVLSQNLTEFEEFTDFMMVDQTYFLESPDKSLLDEDHIDVSGKSIDEICKILGVEN